MIVNEQWIRRLKHYDGLHLYTFLHGTLSTSYLPVCRSNKRLLIFHDIQYEDYNL